MTSPPVVPAPTAAAVPGPVPVLDAAAALAATSGRAAVLLTRWTLGLAEELSRHALRRPVALVPVRFDGALAVVGPVLRPGGAACLVCTEYQRLATAGGRVPWQSPKLTLAGVPSPALAPAVEALVQELLDHPDPAPDLDPAPDPDPDLDSDSAVVHVVHQGRGTWSTHRVRPVGGCDVCRPLPSDAEAPLRPLPSQPRPMPDAAVLRGPNPRTTGAALRAALYDERFGPVRLLRRSEDSAFSLTSAVVTDGRSVDDGGHGRARTFADSERIALFEAVERYAGMRPTGRRTDLLASFAELGPDQAVDPERLGLPDPAHHGHSGSPTVPYTPDLPLHWVRGWSLTHRRPTAVPEHVAYWDVPGPDRPRVVYESSNGCGLGNSPEEAALYGLFEVAERDAFLMAWYAATPLRRIHLPADDTDTLLLADRAAAAGYRLLLLDATNDFGIPAVLAVCRYEGGHPEAPRMFLAAGAHHDPRAAVRSAVAEVVTNVLEAPHRSFAEGGPRDPERLRPMLERPELVLTLDDHVGLSTLPEAAPRLEFLFADTPAVPVAEAWPGAPAPVPDLSDLLTRTVDRLARSGLEVITVDQTEPGLRERFGLHCVKAVVPGALPMTFGHVNRRTLGLPRLLEVPHRLGRTGRPGRHEELPLHPHPFP
ncbi:TOMM precursor leader peptide-binding protein [Streptomyces sp. MB09-01]|uniref:TOMM precursor leader peptide-binding protein n=1 Tax=Streptomyces sp. MB09-01 TaxID=3028666 RepID=UPI00299FF06E|nr:TOMM precursor leader peptide-binding protein [Streptomyces sp. MB09-01]MDX3537887.1 TOMM precursor leader peptide-binding protein [Streptomyces sp. MB09-01]